MAKFFDSIPDKLQTWIQAQHIFFVATAPMDREGRVNLSPKGMNSLRVLGPNRVAYLDLTGSGNETSAHIHENARVTFMWCAFEGSPDIVRVYGQGRTVLPDTPEWAELIPHFEMILGARQIIINEVTSVQTSCGFAVPFFDYVGERDALVKYAETKGEDGLADYRAEKNVSSIDGLPTPLGEQLEANKG